MFNFIQTALAASNTETSAGFTDKVTGFFDYILTRIPNWIAGIALFITAIFIAKIAKSAVEARIENKFDEEHQEVLVLAGRVTYFGTLVIGITIALKVAGIDLTTILAAVAFGIGFALQDLIMNFLSGVLILVSRQFTIGDFIKVGGTVGKVMEIQSRATILKAVDGTKVIVPNSTIFKNQVVSYTTNPLRRITVPVYISYDDDINYASKVAMETVKKHPKVMKKPAPTIIVKDYGESDIELQARFWVGSRDGWVKIRSDLMNQMLSALDEAGIYCPYNTVHFETEKDTAEFVNEYRERSKKKTEEMKLSKMIEEDSKQKTVQITGAKPVSGIANMTPALAPAVAPATEDTEFADQTEIDNQA